MKRKRIENFLYSKFMGFVIVFTILISFCYLDKFPALSSTVHKISSLFSIILITFYMLNCEISRICLSIILYLVLLLSSTILGDSSSIILFLKEYYKIIAICFYLDYGLKYYTKNTIHSFYLSYIITISLNFYTILKYPTGYYASSLYPTNNYFLGYDNIHIFTYLPALVFMFLDKNIFKRNFNLIDYWLFSIITFCVFFSFSATSVIGYSIILLYLLLKKYIHKYPNIFNSKNYLLTYFVAFLGITLFNIQNFFSIIIVNLLHKDLTLTSRTTIWNSAIKLIQEHLLIGYGKENIHFVAAKFGHKLYTHAHNTLLDVMYKGGIIGLIVFINILILSVKELYKNRKHEITHFLSIILFSCFIMMIVEARQEVYRIICNINLLFPHR